MAGPERDEEVAKGFIDSLQVVEIDLNRLEQMNALVRILLKQFVEDDGREEGKIVVLSGRLRKMLEAVYTAAFVDGYMDSSPRLLIGTVENPWGKKK